jgi:hypothetical protein
VRRAHGDVVREPALGDPHAHRLTDGEVGDLCAHLRHDATDLVPEVSRLLRSFQPRLELGGADA